MQLAIPTCGPIFGHSTHASTRVWVRGDKARNSAIIRWHATSSDTPNGDIIWCYKSFGLFATLDWVGVTEIDFEEHSRYLHIEVGIVPAHAENIDYSKLDWQVLNDTCRGRLRRPPNSGEEFSFILGSCRHRGFGPWRSGDQSFRSMAALDLANQADFLLLCGDQVYCDHPINNILPLVPGLFANKPPKSLEGYFEKYRHDFAHPNFREVLRQLPVYMMFDDHEIRNGWAGYKYRLGAGSAQVWSRDTLEWGLRSYLAYQASHSPAVSHFGQSMLSSLAGKQDLGTHRWWYRFEWGNAEFMVLDTRSDRTDPEAPDAVMLGAEQMAALEDFLRQDSGCYKFVVSPVPLAPDTNSKKLSHLDTWRAYPEQRQKLLDFIANEAPTFPIFLSGDLHLSRAVTIRKDVEPRLHLPCVMSSALNWFTLGLQKRGGPLGHIAGFLEDGPLPISLVELQSEQRTGLYYVRNETEALLYNNFVRLTLKHDRVVIQAIRCNSDNSRGNWAFEISKTQLHN